MKRTIGLAMLGVAAVFGLTACAPSATSSAPATVTTMAPALAPVTVTVQAPPAAPVTVTAPPVTVTTAAQAPVVPAPSVETGPVDEITKSGTFIVGTDIQPGQYKTDGKISPSKSVGYFAVLNDPMGDKFDVDNIVTNDNPEGQAFVTLEAGQGLNTENLHWVRVG